MCLLRLQHLQEEGAKLVSTVAKEPYVLQSAHQGRQERLMLHFRCQREEELHFGPRRLRVLPALLAATAQPTAWLKAHLVPPPSVPAQVAMCA